MASTLHTLLKRDKEASLNARYIAVKEYHETYSKIYSPKLTRLMTNTSNLLLMVLTMVLAVIFLLLFAVCIFFAEAIVNKMAMTDITAKELTDRMAQVRQIGCVPLIIGLLFLWISYQIGKLHRKNKIIARMSILLDKMIASEKKNIEAEKEAYFQLLDVIDKDKNKPEIR